MINDSGVSIQVRQAADENGALLLRIHNYQIQRETQGNPLFEGYAVCRSFEKLAGPL